jgi:hypothetical protein
MDMTKRAILLVATNPASDAVDEAYNAWYSDVHIPQILDRVPGFVHCNRYVLHPASAEKPQQRYLAVYEIEADDPAIAVAALGEAVQSGRIDMSDTLDLSGPPGSVLYEAV